jgi:hypothetical protein
MSSRVKHITEVRPYCGVRQRPEGSWSKRRVKGRISGKAASRQGVAAALVNQNALRTWYGGMQRNVRPSGDR